MKIFLICLFYILVILAGYTFVSFLTYEPKYILQGIKRKGMKGKIFFYKRMTGKERIELNETFTPFWR